MSEVVVLKNSVLQETGAYALVLEGCEAILERSALLEAFAERYDRAGMMCWILHFMEARSSRNKVPHLILLLYPGASPEDLSAEDIHDAVLIFEHRFYGFPTGVYATDSYHGFRTITSSDPERRAVAARVVRLLLKRNAHIVKISGEGRLEGTESIATQLEDHGISWAKKESELRYVLSLGTTYEETLAKLGKSTRFNLRYYRRRLLRRMQCEVVPDARGMISRQELEILNANSRRPMPFSQFERRYNSLSRLPSGYLFGVREVGGGWLGLVGGWRQGTTTVLHWQLNVSGYEKDSLVNVVRSYFLEHEAQLGARKLVIYGGTNHSMSHSFDVCPTFDLLVRRRSFRSALICFSMKMILPLSTNPPGEGMIRIITDGNTKWSRLPSRTRQLAPRQVPDLPLE